MAAKITKMRFIAGGFVILSAALSGVFMQNENSEGVQRVTVMPSANVALESGAVDAADLSGPVAPVEPGMDEEVTRAVSFPVLAVPGAAPVLPDAPTAEAVTLASTDAEITEPRASGDQAMVQSPASADCEAGFTAMAAPGAMVDLTLEAPCYGGQLVDIFHAGIRFTEQMDENGLMQVTMPVLEENAFFNALFTDGRTESADVLMLTINDYHRVALFWKSGSGFALYALENGALYGEAGHVSATTPYGPERGIRGEGGFMTQIGQSDLGYQVAVYSYPAMLSDTSPAPEISIEAEVLEGNCGHDITATLLRNSDTGTLEIVPLFIAVPSCDAIGEYLVLKNLPQNQRIANY